MAERKLQGKFKHDRQIIKNYLNLITGNQNIIIALEICIFQRNTSVRD